MTDRPDTTTEAITALLSWSPAETVLRWPVRASFTEYVSSIDDHRLTTDSVEVDDHTVFTFPGDVGDGDGDGDGTTSAFSGAVHFWAHLGVLDFWLADVRLHLDDTPRLTIAAQPRERLRATIAELSGFERASESLVTVGATLTDDGVRLLGGVYSVGDPLDRLQVVHVPPVAG